VRNSLRFRQFATGFCLSKSSWNFRSNDPNFAVETGLSRKRAANLRIFLAFQLRFGCGYAAAAVTETPLNVLAVVGSLHRDSVTRTVVQYVAKELQQSGCAVDILDFEREPLGLYNPDTAHDLPGYAELQQRVEQADLVVLGTPDYHGCISGAMKNFLDHFWHEFAGKLFATIVASHEKGLTVTDQLRTVARQCYAWSLPYGVSFSEDADVNGGQIGEGLRKRLQMMVRDARIYGHVLGQQRRADLAGDEPGFLAKHRGRHKTA